jgi:hypothetical protein
VPARVAEPRIPFFLKDFFRYVVNDHILKGSYNNSRIDMNVQSVFNHHILKGSYNCTEEVKKLKPKEVVNDHILKGCCNFILSIAVGC